MADGASRRISELEAAVQRLPAEDREVFARIFEVEVSTGHLAEPATMRKWIEQRFGTVSAVREQRVIKVTNRITLEGALFNALRGMRSTDFAPEEQVEATIDSTRGGPFCHPETLTPEDVFGEGEPGRVRGKHCLTASNVAKYDGYHSVVIFDEHDPLRFNAERIHDYLATALRWAKRAHNADVEAKYFFLMWNCLWKGGASIVHGHMQVALGRGMHYARVEHWRRQALLYRLAHGENYFQDLYRAHAALGLATELGQTKVIASLTPVKEREVLLVAPSRWLDDDDFQDAIAAVLRSYVHRLGVQSFNLALYQRPIDAAEEDWDGFPAVVRLVDRGDLHVRTTDVGCMELYGSSVIGSDPYDVIEAVGTPAL
jgi:galactose-1-phosphate uridylyltransferase